MEKETEITLGGNITVHGPMFDIHDNHNMYIQTPQQVNLISKEEEVIAKLSALFGYDKEKAKDFLLQIKGERPRRITQIVNEWIQKGFISSENAHRILWSLLNRYGFYDKSENLWNQQVI